MTTFYLGKWLAIRPNPHSRSDWCFPEPVEEQIKTLGEPEFLWVTPEDFCVEPEETGGDVCKWGVINFSTTYDTEDFYAVATPSLGGWYVGGAPLFGESFYIVIGDDC